LGKEHATSFGGLVSILVWALVIAVYVERAIRILNLEIQSIKYVDSDYKVDGIEKTEEI
jgi:hypothetical protein